MEENEIFEEVVTNSSYEVIDGDLLDNSLEEVKSDTPYTSDDIVSALLQLLNEQELETIEDDNLLLNGVGSVSDEDVETVPILVQSVEPSPDYSDILNSLNDRLENVETLLIESNTPKTLDTPLSEYSLDSVLLVCVLVVLGLTLGYQFLKDNFLKF